jgi:hypothetical protein
MIYSPFLVDREGRMYSLAIDIPSRYPYRCK